MLDLHPRVARWALQEFKDNSRRRPLVQDDLLDASQVEYMAARVHEHGRFLLHRGREANATEVVFFHYRVRVDACFVHARQTRSLL